MEWISCEEKMPDHGQSITGKNEFMSMWEEEFDSDEPLGQMTHWKPRYTSIATGPVRDDDKDDVYLDIGFRDTTPEQNYKLRTVRLQDVKDRTMAEIHKMLEDTDDEEW